MVNLRKDSEGNIIPTRRWEPDKSDCGCKKNPERDLNIAVISLVRMCFRSDVAIWCRLKKNSDLGSPRSGDYNVSLQEHLASTEAPIGGRKKKLIRSHKHSQPPAA